jgi:hypothetical protein
MDRDRNIAMGLGSNTNAAATITRSVKDLIQIKYSSIQGNSEIKNPMARSYSWAFSFS